MGPGRGGVAGITNLFDILCSGIDSARLGLGCAFIDDLIRGGVIVAEGFTRTRATAEVPLLWT